MFLSSVCERESIGGENNEDKHEREGWVKECKVKLDQKWTKKYE